MTVRASSLDTAFYCPLAPKLDAQFPEAGRAALMSSYQHAKSAGKLPEAESLWSRLTPDERETVLTWHQPADIEVGGVTLVYREAIREVSLAVDRRWKEVPHGSEEAMTQGTPDWVWIHIVRDELGVPASRIGYVGDIKKTRFTSADGPYSLQLKAYALMLTAKHELDGYCTGIWVADEGEWMWASEVTEVGSRQWLEDTKTVETAALNEGDAVTGSHCSNCWSRLHCPAYTSPPNEGLLAPALEQSGDPELLAMALREADRLEKLCKTVKDNVKEAARRGLPIVDGKKQYRAVRCKGKSSLNVKLLTERHPEIAQECTVHGEAYDQFRWTNRKT